MDRSSNNRLAEKLRLSKQHQRYFGIFAIMATIVALFVASALRQPGAALEHAVQVLDCPYDGVAAHAHDDSCYDDEGKLVCDMPELELHEHTGECYDKDGELICGQEEVLVSHQHGPGCFVTVYVEDDEELEDIDALESDDADEDDLESADEDAAEPTHPARVFSHDFVDEDDNLVLRVDVSAPEGALPANATMRAELIGNDLSDNQVDAIEQAVAEKTDGRMINYQAVDIAFFDEDDNEIEPEKPITVTFTSPLVETDDETYVVHVDDLTEEEAQAVADGADEPERTATVVDALDDKQLDKRDLTLDDDQLAIESETFSTYVLALTTLEKTLEASDGSTYAITVTAPASAGVSQATELKVEEIDQDKDTETFESYVAEVENALGYEAGAVVYARLFDISIVDTDGDEIQPADGSTVSVDIQLTDKGAGTEAQVVHFGDEPEVIDTQCENNTVSFETTGFSVYAIVEIDYVDYQPSGDRTASSLDVVDELGAAGFTVSNKGYYLTGSLVDNVTNDRTGLATTETNPNEEAGTFYFARVGDGSTGQYSIYILEDGDPEKPLYVKMYQVKSNTNRAGLTFTEDITESTPFTLTQGTGTNAHGFRVGGVAGGVTYYWNWTNKTPGKGAIAAFYNATDANVAYIQLHYVAEEAETDPYGLNGQTFGITYHKENVASSGLTGTAGTIDGRAGLKAKNLRVRTDLLGSDGILLVANSVDLQEFTFESIDENHYYLTTEVDGAKRYLTINKGAVTLATAPHETNSVITLVQGYGTHANQWRFTVGNYALTYKGGGFTATTGTDDSTWLNLVRKSEQLTDKDFVTYTAKKVSVSDTFNVFNGQWQLVLYTRVWNDTTKRYEFYAVDHDGSLIRCYDTGDSIEWLGSQVNSALWEFTEYTGWDGKPNYYYELQNRQFGEYIAPQVTNGQVLQNGTIGVNLNGRRYGQNYTTIIAWDDDAYAYAGLKVEGDHIVSCPLSEAEDFYFAVVQLRDSDDELTTVKTIDSNAYGITMKIYDWNNISGTREATQSQYFGSPTPIAGNSNATVMSDNNQTGLLSTNLGEDGYPTATAITRGSGKSLAELFCADAADVAMDANHLFIESTYNESGYFEYSSTSNFAHFNTDGEDAGNFTVYDQLACNGNVTGPTRTHGQFMPFNQIEAGKLADVTNQTTVLYQPLPDTDPRKGEELYLIPLDGTGAADYFFGMELSASFTQTADGLDDWGHDIVFEFSGDDDFWFYVDGELVIDLGGVHSAMVGNVNFRTGKVETSRGESTLYEIFRSNYVARGLSQSEIEQKLGEIFETKVVDGKECKVFTDYSKHTMRIFYMERGASASNLHMRFNLSAVKPGTFLLSKKLSGTDSPSNDLIEFPYQVYYHAERGGGQLWHLLGDEEGEAEGVTYEGTTTEVTHHASFTPAGGTDAYDHVFMLKPGQTAQVALPDDAIDYYVVECGVNPDVYDTVKANGTVLDGEPTANLVGTTARCDYQTSTETMEDRSEVTFDNHVAPGAMRTLSFSKLLYDVDGVTPLYYEAKPENGEGEDKTLFSFRLYLGNESASEDSIPLADLYKYYVKDREGNYCRWNSSQKKFVSLGITEYEGDNGLRAYLETLTSAQKESIIFSTSMNGSISKIPAGYTVEVRDLIVDTKFKVEERDYEVPKGYKMRVGDGYQLVVYDEESERETTTNYETTPVVGTIEVKKDKSVLVSNQKGWGLTIEKVWTDKDFMAQHDPVYFAVYVKGDDGGLTLLDGTVRELKTTEDEVYYFFDALENGKDFNQYLPFEVTLEGDYTVDGKGVVSGYTGVTRVRKGETIDIGGQPVGGEHSESGFVYTVSYRRGELSDRNENVRTDVATNSRPGIEIYKYDWAWQPLKGVTFTLVGEDGNAVAAESYTSDKSGLVTIAYLSEGTYTLAETAVPESYAAVPCPLTIVVEKGASTAYTVRVESSDPAVDVSEYVRLTRKGEDGHESDEMDATIRIRNRRNELDAFKIDASTKDQGAGEQALAGAHFSLYRQVTTNDGHRVKDYRPMTDYEDLVTGADGAIPGITMELPAGTYYLCETSAAEGYGLIPCDVCLSIGADGIVRIENADEVADFVELVEVTDAVTGHVTFRLKVYDESMELVQVVKTDALTKEPLEGATFELYAYDDYNAATGKPKEGATRLANGTSDADGVVALGELRPGRYVLIETVAPDGYNLPTEPIEIVVAKDSVAALQGGSQLNPTFDEDDGIWSIVAPNSSGYELPHTGGVGFLERLFGH